MKTIINNVFTGVNLKFTVILIVMLFSCFSLKAQDAPKYTIKFKLSIKDGDQKNALITITKNGAAYRVIDPSGGKYSVDLDFGGEYLFTCTKMGYITKSLIIDTHIPAGRETGDFAKNYPTVELEKQPEDQEITYTQPVGRIKFSGVTDDFDFDKDYTQKALEMQTKAEANPKPKPKPPTPNPRPIPPVTATQTTLPSKPEPVVIKQPEIKSEPPKPKPILVEPVIVQKPIVKNKEEKIIQEDRRKITIVTVNIDGTEFVYKKEEYTWGGVYFYRDSKNITEPTYDKETR